MKEKVLKESCSATPRTKYTITHFFSHLHSKLRKKMVLGWFLRFELNISQIRNFTLCIIFKKRYKYSLQGFAQLTLFGRLR